MDFFWTFLGLFLLVASHVTGQNPCNIAVDSCVNTFRGDLSRAGTNNSLICSASDKLLGCVGSYLGSRSSACDVIQTAQVVEGIKSYALSQVKPNSNCILGNAQLPAMRTDNCSRTIAFCSDFLQSARTADSAATACRYISYLQQCWQLEPGFDNCTQAKLGVMQDYVGNATLEFNDYPTFCADRENFDVDGANFKFFQCTELTRNLTNALSRNETCRLYTSLVACVNDAKVPASPTQQQSFDQQMVRTFLPLQSRPFYCEADNPCTEELRQCNASYVRTELQEPCDLLFIYDECLSAVADFCENFYSLATYDLTANTVLSLVIEVDQTFNCSVSTNTTGSSPVPATTTGKPSNVSTSTNVLSLSTSTTGTTTATPSTTLSTTTTTTTSTTTRTTTTTAAITSTPSTTSTTTITSTTPTTTPSTTTTTPTTTTTTTPTTASTTITTSTTTTTTTPTRTSTTTTTTTTTPTPTSTTTTTPTTTTPVTTSSTTTPTTTTTTPTTPYTTTTTPTTITTTTSTTTSTTTTTPTTTTPPTTSSTFTPTTTTTTPTTTSSTTPTTTTTTPTTTSSTTPTTTTTTPTTTSTVTTTSTTTPSTTSTTTTSTTPNTTTATTTSPTTTTPPTTTATTPTTVSAIIPHTVVPATETTASTTTPATSATAPTSTAPSASSPEAKATTETRTVRAEADFRDKFLFSRIYGFSINWAERTSHCMLLLSSSLVVALTFRV